MQARTGKPLSLVVFHFEAVRQRPRRLILPARAIVIALLLSAASMQCGTKEERLDHSQESPPGDLAGTYRLSPTYQEETLVVQPGGETEYRVKRPGETQVRHGLSYRNRFRMIVFLDGEAEPTGIFLLQDREQRWPGRWKGEMRFLEAAR